MEVAAEKIEQFNVEEEAFKWDVSSYPLRKELASTLSPYLKLYETTVQFNTKHKYIEIHIIQLIVSNSVGKV